MYEETTETYQLYYEEVSGMAFRERFSCILYWRYYWTSDKNLLDDRSRSTISNVISRIFYYSGILDIFEDTVRNPADCLKQLIAYSSMAIIIGNDSIDPRRALTFVTRNLRVMDALQIIERNLELGREAGRRFLSQGHTQIGDSED